MILYRAKQGEKRSGYLVDWELARKLDKVVARPHVLTVGPVLGTPAFMSIKALMVQGHTHRLEDDLESFIYVILYASLRWLPVVSPTFPLDWWLTEFFSAPNLAGGGGDKKLANAMYRTYTQTLDGAKATDVMQWLNKAMDLHFTDETSNPKWSDGKALDEMWTEFLQRTLPVGDRYENQVPDMAFRRTYSLAATYTAVTSSSPLFYTDDQHRESSAAKRTRSESAGAEPKRQKKGRS